MGLYIFITNECRTKKRKVADEIINNEFQEALKYDPSLMIEQYSRRRKKGFFKYENEIYFNIYHETAAHDGTAYQARQQMSASGQKEIVIAYLHGIINGSMHTKPITP